MSKTFYLKDKGFDYIIAKFERDDDDLSFKGSAYECISWGLDKKPCEWLFHSNVYCKWDCCTHWWFFGEDYNGGDEIDAYYHLCSDLQSFIAIMCFIWKLAGNYWSEKGGDCKEYNLELVDKILEEYEIIEEKE